MAPIFVVRRGNIFITSFQTHYVLTEWRHVKMHNPILLSSLATLTYIRKSNVACAIRVLRTLSSGDIARYNNLLYANSIKPVA